MDPVRLLIVSGALLMLFTSLVGVVLLVPLQPWAKKSRFWKRFPAKAVLSAHVDWVVLSLMQFAAALGISQLGAPALWPAWALVYGGWLNATAYVFRGVGIDAFVFAGPLRQRAVVGLMATSVLAILAGWTALIVHWI